MAFAPEIPPELTRSLSRVLDPEVGVNIVDLGLVYAARSDDGRIDVQMTLTSRGCPMGQMVVEDVHDQLVWSFPEAGVVNVELVWEPPWSPDLITKAGRAALGQTSEGQF